MEYYSWFFINIAFDRNVSAGHCFSISDVQEINSQTENEKRTHILSGNYQARQLIVPACEFNCHYTTVQRKDQCCSSNLKL